MRIACFEINHIPDLSLNKYQSLADTGVEGVLTVSYTHLDVYKRQDR